MLPSFIEDRLELPVIAAPMFLISGPRLVTACCIHGVIGTLPALNQRTTEGFESWLEEIENTLADFEIERGRKPAPFGVNLIVHHSNPRLEADLEVVVRHKVPVIITSLGAVSEVVDSVHSYGGIVLHDVTTKRHAEKAIEAGVDGLICVSTGAGGHGGTLNPMAFLAEVRRFFDGIVVLAGCISTGQDIAASLLLGANLAYMGTRFINTEESKAPEAYKKMIIESDINEIIYTAAISGVPANFLRRSLEAAGITKERWHQRKKVDFGNELDTEAKIWKTIWSAGQGVASIDDVVSVKDLIDRLKIEYLKTVTKLNDKVD